VLESYADKRIVWQERQNLIWIYRGAVANQRLEPAGLRPAAQPRTPLDG
jgi:hypothetical protein